MARIQLPRNINSKTVMQSSLPVWDGLDFLNCFGVGVKACSRIRLVVLLGISGIGNFYCPCITPEERKYDLAILRALGPLVFNCDFDFLWRSFVDLFLESFFLGLDWAWISSMLIRPSNEQSIVLGYKLGTFLPEEGWILRLRTASRFLASIISVLGQHNKKLVC